ncbi:hypothetical protein Agub_g213, partial [Astrephomene gubernaculifera]
IASLRETAEWLETFHGYMIMLISYFMAGGTAALAQMCVAGQPTGIAGVAAALGMEAAVFVRCWRMTGEALPPTPACLALIAVAALMAAYQPLVGAWGIVGGVLGGALSGVLAYDVLYGMRVVLGVSMLLALAGWEFLTWLPQVVWQWLVVAGIAVWEVVKVIVQAVRGV